ncbi:MAG: SH3 domain-containing protein [Chloroflexi bacterium]|nr:SH3 domain-containing protein [Chloroflexota bacterium]
MNLQKRSFPKKLTLLIAIGLVLLITMGANAQTTGTTTPTAFWRGEYFNNTDLSGTPVLVRPEPTIDYNWGNASPAPPVVATDRFSVRWTRILNLAAGQYQFTATTDDGVRLWVNDQALIDQWAVHQAQPLTATVDLPGGDTLVRMEYFEDTGTAVAQLTWASVGATAQAATGDNPVVGIITGTQTLNVRSGPGTGSGLLTTLASGQLIAIEGRNTDSSWLQIRLANGSIGWISALYVTPNLTLVALPVTNTAPPVAAGLATTAIVTGTQVLNVRSGPDSASAASTTLTAGQTVLLQGRNADATWLQVRLPDGQLGWVSSLYVAPAVAVETLPVASATAPVGVGGETFGVVVGAGRLNVRNGPGTGFNQLASLTDGQRIGLEGRNADATWLQIRLGDGSLGWVSSTYIIPNLLRSNLPVIQ